MARFELLGTAAIPGQAGELRLLRRNDEFSIRIVGKPGELMNSRLHGSEDALATLPCEQLADRRKPRVLIGGLGMGFTLAAALNALGEDAEVVVAELVPGVVEWNRGPLGAVAGHPLRDPRTRMHLGDVGELLRTETAAYDAIMLDVDNGPEGLTQKANDWIYSTKGLAAAQKALRRGGILAVWSAGAAPEFTDRLAGLGFAVDPVTVRAHKPGKGARHVVWLAW